jgi:hypothetical protein
MEIDEGMLIRVHGSWKGWRNAEVKLGNIRGVHWSQPDQAPNQLLYGFISCTDIVSGEIPHECDHGSAPHDLLVCVLKRHVVSSAYATLVRSAEQRGGFASPSTSREARAGAVRRFTRVASEMLRVQRRGGDPRNKPSVSS